ncbi:MAG: MAPEG family protein [Phenylobacterium sp.]
MDNLHLVAIVTAVALMVYVWMGLRVGAARRASGIAAPAMSGDPMLERHLRVQGNTLEWLPIFIPSLWLFALYFGQLAAAGVGLVWIAGRIVYALGYAAEPRRRAAGFGIQFLACAVLLFGVLGKAALSALSH